LKKKQRTSETGGGPVGRVPLGGQRTGEGKTLHYQGPNEKGKKGQRRKKGPLQKNKRSSGKHRGPSFRKGEGEESSKASRTGRIGEKRG